jgi:hypothetical protein
MPLHPQARRLIEAFTAPGQRPLHAALHHPGPRDSLKSLPKVAAGTHFRSEFREGCGGVRSG